MPEPISPLDPAPDFRRMTVDELRQGISTLSALARDLRRFRATGQTGYLAAWGEDKPGAKLAEKFLPSAGLVIRLGSMQASLEPTGGRMLGNDLVEEAEQLQCKYKHVWRSRPGNAFRDVAARAKREDARRKARGWFGRPKLG